MCVGTSKVDGFSHVPWSAAHFLSQYIRSLRCSSLSDRMIDTGLDAAVRRNVTMRASTAVSAENMVYSDRYVNTSMQRNDSVVIVPRAAKE